MLSERRASLILLFATVLAAWGWIFSKEAIQGLPPFGFVGLRFIAASLFLLPFCLKAFRRSEKADLIRAGGVGSILSCALLSWIYAMSVSTSIGEGAFIMSLSMLFVPPIAWLLFKQAPARIFWVSMPIAVCGLALLSLGGVGWQLSASQIWFLLAAVCLAIHFNANSRYAQRIPALVLTCVQLFVTGVVATIASLLTETWPEHVPSNIWVWFGLSVLVATSLRYLMQTLGQKGASAANAAIIMILEPVWTVILSVVWYHEAMPAHKIAGCSLILASLLIYRGAQPLRNLIRRNTKGGC
ncbi:putative DMT superfamily transporter inner membrane protein [Grimontia celer]|uniref:Putative DMT superfamily transporter inner membrane protein n=1 Tax=Grimontia celer TaxID=1796497 RepID=A0A128EVU8_9GAMM|nr:DMT family transporter [Grimontia celer]CZF78126.1 putative DMT superfamily transporter inner membrane protein [Grimontia celer]